MNLQYYYRIVHTSAVKLVSKSELPLTQKGRKPPSYVVHDILTPVPDVLELGLLWRGDESTAAGLTGLFVMTSVAMGLLARVVILCGGVGRGGGDTLSSSLGRTAS